MGLKPKSKMEKQIRILTPNQILRMVYTIDRVAGEWQLGKDWRKQEPELANITHEDEFCQIDMAHIYKNKYVN